jgi:hypothetical protein
MIICNPIDTTGYTKPVEWCGPGSLSLLTGLPLVRSTEMLTRIRQQPYSELEGVWTEEVIIALRELGYTAEPMNIQAMWPSLTHGPRLSTFFMRIGATFDPIFVEVDGHFLVAHMGNAGDNWTMRMVPVSKFPKQGRLVKTAHIIRRQVCPS